MVDNLSKYLHKDMDKQAGVQHTYHRTKIVATVGPACDTYEKLLELVKAGVNVFRLNFSHGTLQEKGDIIALIKRLNKEEPYNVAIIGDLQGPKLRVGDILNGLLEINVGDVLTFTSHEKVLGTKERIYLSYPNLHSDVKAGDKILIDDGKLEMVVIEITSEQDVKVVVTTGGILLPKKGLNLPDTEISLPPLTEKDLSDLAFIIEQKIEWVALSFVRKAEDIIDLISGGVAVLYIGAATEMEMKEKKDRVDDALHATRAAVEEGIVPGGGVAYIRAVEGLDGLKGINDDETTGITIVKRALEEPIRQIVVNSGIEGSIVVQKVKESKDDFGFNARTEVYENLYKAGVIDPTKVTRIALENAASIAGMLLTTECVVADKPEPKSNAAPAMPHGGGMGMDY